MTRRNTPFTVTSTIPTPKTKNTQPPANPLSAFFRKSKLDLDLPSRGQWYPEGCLELVKGKLAIFAMNANDDIRLRTGDVTLTGKNLYEVIQSCVPGIKSPKDIPYIDADAILLAIRAASYGDSFEYKVSVPKTTLTRTLTISASKLLKELANRKAQWDENIQIEDESGQVLELVIRPVPLSQVFATSKIVFEQRKALNKNLDSDSNIENDELFSQTLDTLANSAIDLVCASISTLRVIGPDKQLQLELSDSEEIADAIHSMDVEYFNAIKTHVEQQRKKYTFVCDNQISTPEEIAAGADATWIVDLSFVSSSFLPTQ